jgi:23S rRNA pseudouridine1911/1915/1917 synthase
LKGTKSSAYEKFMVNNFALLPGQALHAKTLGFIQPRTKEYLEFDSELPEGFQRLLERWRTYCSDFK